MEKAAWGKEGGGASGLGDDESDRVVSAEEGKVQGEGGEAGSC